MKVIVPMAGRGARFAERGYHVPKPLVEVAGKPMLYWALQSLEGMDYSEIVFVALEEHERQWGLEAATVQLGLARSRLILLPEVTEGQLCTVMAARNYLSADEDVLVASSDTFVVSDLSAAIQSRGTACRGIISVANLPGEQWSFARTDFSGRVVEVAEKRRISNHASTGLYYFAHGADLLQAGDAMIHNREKTIGEYYVIPVYRKFVELGWRVEINVASEMWDMGTPEAKAAFESHVVQRASRESDRGQIAAPHPFSEGKHA